MVFLHKAPINVDRQSFDTSFYPRDVAFLCKYKQVRGKDKPSFRNYELEFQSLFCLSWYCSQSSIFGFKKGGNVGTGKLLVSQGPHLRRRGCLALAFSPSGVSIPTLSSSRPGSLPGAFGYSGTFVKLREAVRRVHVINKGDCESESFSNFPKSQFLRSRALPIRVSQTP